MNQNLDIDIMLDGLSERWRDAAPWLRIRMVYAACSGINPPDETTLAAIVKEATTEFERLGLLFILGPRDDLIARMNHPDERRKAARILRWMRATPDPGTAWILEPDGPPPASVAEHPVLDHASPDMLAAIIAPALVNDAHAPATKRLAARCHELLKRMPDAEAGYGAFGVGLARHGAWHALHAAASLDEACRSLVATTVLYLARSAECIAQCADHGVFHPLFLPALTSAPETLAAVIRIAGARRDQWSDDVIRRIIDAAVKSRTAEPILAAIAAFGPRNDLLAAADACGAHNGAMHALKETPHITLADIDHLPKAPWELALRVGHHPKLFADAVTTRNATAYAVALWEQLHETDRRAATLAAILENNITTLARVPFESTLPAARTAAIPIPPLNTLDAMATMISALRERAERYGRESLQTDVVSRIRDALLSSDQGRMLWIASSLPLPPDLDRTIDAIIRDSALDIARLASTHGWALSPDRRDAVIRALMDTGDQDMMANATQFLGWDRRLIDAALAPSDRERHRASGSRAPDDRVDPAAQRALTCIRGLVSAGAWNDVPGDAAIALIAEALRDPKCDAVALIALCGPLPILTAHVLNDQPRGARTRHISPITIARAMRAHGDIPDHHRDALAQRCLNNAYTACDLAQMIGHHPRLETIARTYHATAMYYDRVFEHGRWDASLLDHPDGRLRIGHEAAMRPSTLHAFVTMPMSPSVFLSAMQHPSLLAARIAADHFPEAGAYADAARVISARPSEYSMRDDEHGRVVELIMSRGDPVSRAVFRHRSPICSTFISSTATDHEDVAVHLARLLRRHDADELTVHALVSALQDSHGGIELLLRVASRIGHRPEIAAVFHSLAPSWRERYQQAVGAPAPDAALDETPISRIQRIVTRRR